MAKSKKDNRAEEKQGSSIKYNDELFEKKFEEDEIESDGSASAFDETESVNEDNFDDLSEK